MSKIFSKAVVAALLVSVMSVGISSMYTSAEAAPSLRPPYAQDGKRPDKNKRPAPPVRRPAQGPSKNMPPVHRPPERKVPPKYVPPHRPEYRPEHRAGHHHKYRVREKVWHDKYGRRHMDRIHMDEHGRVRHVEHVY